MTKKETPEIRDWRNLPRSELLSLAMRAVDCARGEAEAGGDTRYVRLCDEVIFPFLEAEAGEKDDGPTPFGAAVLEVAWERGLWAPQLELHPRHVQALTDHLNGIDNRNEDDLALAVARSIGLNPEAPADEKERKHLGKIALRWTFSDRLPPEYYRD